MRGFYLPLSALPQTEVRYLKSELTQNSLDPVFQRRQADEVFSVVKVSKSVRIPVCLNFCFQENVAGVYLFYFFLK